MSNTHICAGKWWPISIAPHNVDLEVGVVDGDGVHRLVFPVHKYAGRWLDASTRKPVNIEPSHWRDWLDGPLY
jgi:hypothetical protein